MGTAAAHTADVPDQKLKASFFPFEIGGAVELLMPSDETGPIRKFLDKRGPGIHHIAFEVTNIEEKIEELKGKGYQMIDETPRIGATGDKIAFLHPKSTAGILIELKQE
jgi:methylmalonyl-CoA/ethylmalonyl-CoA epimerase